MLCKIDQVLKFEFDKLFQDTTERFGKDPISNLYWETCDREKRLAERRSLFERLSQPRFESVYQRISNKTIQHIRRFKLTKIIFCKNQTAYLTTPFRSTPPEVKYDRLHLSESQRAFRRAEIGRHYETSRPGTAKSSRPGTARSSASRPGTAREGSVKGREQGGKRVKEGVSPTNHLEVTTITKVCLQLRGYFSCSWVFIQSKDTTTTLSFLDW